ncbi:ATP-binding protein [Pedobacter gandavensis]|uniref:histidine kinase n=1 Tax=Pedobacter gandavensis TaxID=2679963 RepID=A0ABR6F294_9SPHI|nr:ATP-binding protein [Pedobacter gandavensis]MBB2151336.1 PAS domain-containing protein [Pedobacter gandavensis]
MKPNINLDAFYKAGPPILVLKPDPPYFTIIEANDAYLKVTSTTLKDLLGRPILTAFPQNPNDAASKNTAVFYNSLLTVMETKQQHVLNILKYDIPIRGTDQFEVKYWMVTNFPVLDDQGNVAYIVHTNVDVTSTYELVKKERIEIEVEDWTNKHLREFFAHAPVAIAMLKGRDLKVELANTLMLEIWGKSMEIIGKRMSDVLPPSIKLEVLSLISQTYCSGRSHYNEDIKMLLARDGSLQEAYFNMMYHPLRDSSDCICGVIIMAAEVTEQVKGKADLLQEQQRSRLAIEAADLGVFDMDVEHGVLKCDLRCKEIFGIGGGDVYDQAQEFMDALHEEDKNRLVKLMRNAFKRPLKNGDYDVEFRTVSTINQQMRWVRAKGKLFFNEQGMPGRFIGTVLDNTRQKREEQLKNDFIAMVSHELKTPLTSLKAYVQLMKRQGRNQIDHLTAETLEKAETQVNKMVSMINSFLNISRLEAGGIMIEKSAFEFNTLILEVIEEVKAIVDPHVITFSGTEELWLTGDRDKIGQVLTNLLSNAAKYSLHNRDIRLDCRRKDARAQISVTDRGMGIRETDLPYLFTRFQRFESADTKNISGFGIGLYLCSEIVKSHHGVIWAESEYGKGTTMFFELPIK